MSIQQKAMWDAIKISEVIENDTRLNALYYNLDVRDAKKVLKASKFEIVPLLSKNGFLKNAYFPGRFKRVYAKTGIPFLGSSEILQVNPIAKKFLSESHFKEKKELFVEDGWVLLSRSGTIGNIVFATKTFQGVAISDHVIRLIPKNFEDACFLYIYLKTEPAQRIIFGVQFGSVVPEIDPKEFDKIPIPIMPQKIKEEITNDVKKINSLRTDVIELFQKSDTMLHELLDLTPLNEMSPKYLNKENNVFNIDLKNLENRFDGSYHIPLVGEIVSNLKKSKFEVVTVKDKRISSETILPGRFKRIYVEKEFGIPFLGGKQMQQFDLSKIKHLSKTSHDTRIKKELTLNENMILITCSGTIGNTIIAPKYFEGWTGSQHIIRVVPSEKMNPGYLYAYLSSDYGLNLIQKYTFGSVVEEIYDENVDNIPIPLPSTSIMDKIGNPILEANKKLDEAYRLEQKTIKKVKELIFGKI
jgi:type I restriction enzyme, S subunit